MNKYCDVPHSHHVPFLFIFFSLPVSPLVVTLVIQFQLKYPEASSSWSTSQAIFSLSLVLCLSMPLVLLLYFPLWPPTTLHERVYMCASVGPPLNHLQMSSPNTSSHLPFFSILSSPLPDKAVAPLHLPKWLPSSTVCVQIYDNTNTHTTTPKTIWTLKPHSKMAEFYFNSKQNIKTNCICKQIMLFFFFFSQN